MYTGIGYNLDSGQQKETCILNLVSMSLMVLAYITEGYLRRQESYAVHRISHLVGTMAGTRAKGEAMKFLLEVQGHWLLENFRS